MTDQVWVTITGVRTTPDGEQQRTQTRFQAAYRENGKTRILRYAQAQEGGEAVSCTLTVEEDRIIMQQEDFGSTMSMIMGEETDSGYGTPYGTIPMKIFTQRVAVKESPVSIHARAHYRMKMEPDYEIRNMITIRIEPLKKS